MSGSIKTGWMKGFLYLTRINKIFPQISLINADQTESIFENLRDQRGKKNRKSENIRY
jgi:LPS sulfotransferase NodH